MNGFSRVATTALACAMAIGSAQAMTLNDYLIVGQYVNDTAVDVSNFELGRVSANAASAPAVSGPGVGPTISNTPTYDGNVAVVNSTGTYQSSDVDIYADRGIDCEGTYASCTDNGSNLSNTRYDDAAPVNLRNISNGDGVNENVDLQPVVDEIELFRTYIHGLTGADITGSIATSSGNINGDLTVNLTSGLNILNFSGTGGNDITVQNGNLIFQGAADAFAIVLVNDDALFKTSQANLLIGNGGIGLNNVVIVSRTEGNAGNIDISNTDINGVALYDLALDLSGGGDPALLSNLSVDNMSGCTQLVGNDVDIQNVRLSRCAFDTSVIQPVPVPAAVWLFGSALGLLGWLRRRVA